jgi:truncated hemoglobin YjbI
MLDTNRARILGRIGAHQLHATHNPANTTQKAREAFLARFEVAVDPDGLLPEAERRRRAGHLRRAHMGRLSLLGVEARRRNRAAREGRSG